MGQWKKKHVKEERSGQSGRPVALRTGRARASGAGFPGRSGEAFVAPALCLQALVWGRTFGPGLGLNGEEFI